MEKKEKKCHLRLVKTQPDTTVDECTQKPETAQPPRSSFAKQMTGFADDLDRMIEAILRA